MNRQLNSDEMRKPKEDIIIYLDSHRVYKNGFRELYVDFLKSDDFQYFSNELESDITDSSASYICLSSIRINRKLEYDTFYHLNIEELKRLKSEYDLRFSIVEDSYVIGGRIDFSKVPEYADILQPCTLDEIDEIEKKNVDSNSEYINFQTYSEYINYAISKPVLYVADVGQANWNELRDEDKSLVVFDCGSPINCGKVTTDAIWDRHKFHLQQNPAALVISHWDIDHYQCLVKRSVADLSSCFTTVFCPSPKSKTSIDVRDSLKSIFGKRYIEIPAKVVNYNRQFWPKMKLLFRNNQIALYKGNGCTNINHCGIALFVKGNKKTAIFTGDLKIGQCRDIWINESVSKPHVLIVPHHGGSCGKRSLNEPYSIDIAILSVGIKNIYHHPSEDVMRYLKIYGRKIKRTDRNGDVIQSL